MKRLLGGLVLLVVVGAAAFWILTSPRWQSDIGPIPAGAPNLDNGRAMFFAGDCTSCHATPGQPDKTRLGGGLALTSAFGTFYVPNVSPDVRDGIGGWTVEQFARAMHAGVAPDGQHLYPSFPYTSFQRMTATDLRDLFAFMKTLPAVQGRVREHALSFPYNIRRGLGLWKLRYLDGAVFQPDPSKSAAWNRGAYLVEGPAHCAECHSPRDAFGGIIPDRRFTGGPNPDGRGFVPNITPDPETGIGKWTKADLVELLTTGFTPEFDSVGSNMASVVENTSKLSQADREAIADYILSLAPKPATRPPAQSAPAGQSGG
ncbi:c-type cytochrome [Chelatococcus sp. GCM10030263]|uniref:c-type cytochrome n=1 Tax=Chelatococcus sp. GCM10030263 TaxID=3273387 RepID=UPI003622E842